MPRIKCPVSNHTTRWKFQIRRICLLINSFISSHSLYSSMHISLNSLFQVTFGAWVYLVQPPGIRTMSMYLALKDAWTNGIKWYSYVSQANNCPTHCYISVHPFTCGGSCCAFNSILFLQFFKVTITSFKYNKRLCSITFCSQPNCYATFFMFSYSFFPTIATVISETIWAKKGVSSNAITLTGWYEYFILFVIFLHVMYMRQFLLLKEQDLSTLERIFFATISYVISKI